MLGRNSLKSYSLNSPKNDSINEERSFKKDLKFDSLSQSEEINNMPIIQIGDVGEENKELSIISSESHSDNQQNILNIEHLHSKENNANVKSYIIHSECVHHTIEDWEEEVKSMPIIDSNLLLESFKIHKNTGCIDFATNAESPFIQKIYGSNKIKDSIINNNEEIICIQNN